MAYQPLAPSEINSTDPVAPSVRPPVAPLISCDPDAPTVMLDPEILRKAYLLLFEEALGRVGVPKVAATGLLNAAVGAVNAEV